MSSLNNIPLNPSTFETIDYALYDFINETLNIFCETNKGSKKVPVIWSGAERAKQSKEDNHDKRDINGALIFPIISIERTSINKSIESKGKFYANIPAEHDYKKGSVVIAQRIKQDKTANFVNADSFKNKFAPRQINFPSKKEKKKTVIEFASIPQPVYYEIMYKIKIKTEFQQQMNEILSPFINKPGSINRVMLKRDGYSYEAFIQPEFEIENSLDNMSEEQRKFETTITIKVFGYLIGNANANQDGPFITIRENIVEIKIGREQVIFGDIPEHSNIGKYRN